MPFFGFSRLTLLFSAFRIFGGSFPIGKTNGHGYSLLHPLEFDMLLTGIGLLADVRERTELATDTETLGGVA
jgi:hypothetical protein